MARTASIYARVEPDIKDKAENILNQMGIPMSNAIGMFLRQVVLQRGIPFDMKLPQDKPVSYGALSEKEFNEKMENALEQYNKGQYISADEVESMFKKEYNL